MMARVVAKTAHNLRPWIVAGAVLALLVLPGPVIWARDATYRELEVFARVLTLIENNYVEEVDARSLIYGAIEGMMAHLDPHSVFLRPEAYAEIKEGTDGSFGGVGLELTRSEGRVLVVTPIDGTPAERAGLRAGDVIVSIDGAPISDLPLNVVVHRLRGPLGSRVVLGLFREGFAAPREVSLVRERIEVSPVSYERRGKIGIVRIRAFQERTARDVRRALEQLRQDTGGHPGGVILDLRNNPGGLLDQAVAVCDLFLSKGVIVTTRGRTSPQAVERAHRPGTEPDYPLAILVNEGTASASEIVAAALREHGRAVLVGRRTFGKGSVQTIIDLDDGSGLKLTIAYYYTPRGVSIHGRGIEPDLDVAARPPAAKVAAGALLAQATQDPQLGAALEALRTWPTTRKMIARPRPGLEKRGDK